MKNSKKDKESDTDRNILSKFVEGVLVFFISALLLKIGIGYILSVRVPIIIILAIAAIVVITYRICRWKRYHDDY